MTDYPHHPAAAIFPLMNEKELSALAKDIETNGLLMPIELLDDQVLDGRNREAACKLAQIEPRYTSVSTTSPLAYVVSKNLIRRHLPPRRAAAIALSLRDKLAEEARARQKAGVTLTPFGVKVSVSEKTHDPARNTNAAIAKIAGTGESTVGRMVQIAKDDPALFERVKAGTDEPGELYRHFKKHQPSAVGIKHQAEKKKLTTRPFALGKIKRFLLEVPHR